MRPRVLLDADGVLFDFVGGALDVVLAVTGVRHGLADVERHDVCAALHLPEPDRTRVLEMIRSVPGFCYRLAPLPDAIESVKALREIADVRIVTAPWPDSPTWMHERTAALREHFKIGADHVTFTAGEEKQFVDGDMLVDDRAVHVDAWAERRPSQAPMHAVHWRTLHNRTERPRRARQLPGEISSQWPHLLGIVYAEARRMRADSTAIERDAR